MCPTVEIVDLEEEDELLVGALAGELVHRVDELGHGDRPVTVAVEDPEGALHEEGLETERKRTKMRLCTVSNFCSRYLLCVS